MNPTISILLAVVGVLTIAALAVVAVYVYQRSRYTADKEIS